jgi:para-nitrobenzyl esterase
VAFLGIPYSGPLTLNVWTPGRDGAAPVLVWVYGGGYELGSASRPEYDGSVLAAAGVVVVTFDYRVGVEGFGPVPNPGLLDQVAALEWVRDHIGSYGGDPARVTVFGQSAGAGCVAALLAMPRAAGLFRRAIVQSMPGTYFTPELDAASSPLLARRGIRLSPVVDGDVLPTDPWTALRAGAARDVDLVVGHTRHEHRLFALLDGTLGTAVDPAEALALYAPGPYPPGPDVHETVHSDWLFRMPSLHLAEAHTGRTFLYELTWPAPGFSGALGACHGLDVPLVFGTLTAGEPAALLADDLPSAALVSEQMISSWTAFAATGDPGWPPYGPDRLTRLFDLPPAVAPYPEETSRRIWSAHRFAALAPAEKD